MKNQTIKLLIVLSIFTIQNSCSQTGEKAKIKIQTGKYGLISLIVKNDSVCGVFQYYDKFNNRLNEYESKNDYYFFGSINNKNDTVFLILTNPYEKKEFGDEGKAKIIIKNDSLQYFQSSLEGMFQPVYFTDKINSEVIGYKTNLKQSKNWIEIRFVKSKLAFFYGRPAGARKKSYLVKYDLAYVIEKKGSWLLIEYYQFGSEKPTVKGWIHENDLLAKDIKDW